jgi:hypothetical protein
MSSITVRGYHHGVSVALVADDAETPHPVNGIITQAPPRLLAALDGTSGRRTVLGGTGAEVTAGLDTLDGVLAALHATPGVEITDVDGDIPATYPGHEPDDERPRDEIVH